MTTTLNASETTPTTPESPPTPRARSAAASWNRIGLAALLIGTAVLYLWNITINGMGNQFYAAAAQAGVDELGGVAVRSLDPQNFITVDKPPLSQWVMGLSGQLFGFSSASMLIPQALMAVGAVALIYAAVSAHQRAAGGTARGRGARVDAGGGADVPVQQPRRGDGVVDDGCGVLHGPGAGPEGARWMALAGVALGFAFLAKMLEGVMVMPALAGAYLVAAPVPSALAAVSPARGAAAPSSSRQAGSWC